MHFQASFNCYCVRCDAYTDFRLCAARIYVHIYCHIIVAANMAHS